MSYRDHFKETVQQIESANRVHKQLNSGNFKILASIFFPIWGNDDAMEWGILYKLSSGIQANPCWYVATRCDQHGYVPDQASFWIDRWTRPYEHKEKIRASLKRAFQRLKALS